MDSVLILHNLSFLSSGGVVIYFDRIEVVNILDSSSGKVNLMKYYHMSMLITVAFFFKVEQQLLTRIII